MTNHLLLLGTQIIDMIYSSGDKLTHSTNFLRVLGKHALIAQEESPSTTGEEEIEDKKNHFISLMLNLVNTFLYMVYFSAWSSKLYFRALVFSSIVLFLGNVCYALAYDMKSLTVLIIGRLLCGLGSARVVNRGYLSDCVPARIHMQASTGFVIASALGMACGPALAGLLQLRFKIYMVTFSQSTLPGWLMAVSWLLHLVWLWISFKEPNHAEVDDTPNPASRQRVDIEQVENGLAQLLLGDSKIRQNEDDDVEDNGEESAQDSRKPATSIGSAYRLLTSSVKRKKRWFLFKFPGHIRGKGVHNTHRSNTKPSFTPFRPDTFLT